MLNILYYILFSVFVNVKGFSLNKRYFFHEMYFLLNFTFIQRNAIKIHRNYYSSHSSL